MRDSRSQAAQHITLENVCTRRLPRSSHRPASGLSNTASARRPERFEPLEEHGVAALDQPLVEEDVRGREHGGAIDVVLHLPVGVVADPHGPHAAISGQRFHDLLAEREIAVDAIDGLQRFAARGDDADDVPEIALHGFGGAQPIQRVDDEVAVAKPAVAVVPVAGRSRGLGDRRRHRGDDRPGVVVRILLQRDRRADDRGLPFERYREPAYPVVPVLDRLLDEPAADLVHGARDGLVGPEEQRDAVAQEERPFLENGGQRCVGREPQRHARHDVADVAAADGDRRDARARSPTAGRNRTRMRGLPARRRTTRTWAMGWKTRPCCMNRGTQSVISIAPPAWSNKRVTSTAVFVLYDCSARARSMISTA